MGDLRTDSATIRPKNVQETNKKLPLAKLTGAGMTRDSGSVSSIGLLEASRRFTIRLF